MMTWDPASHRLVLQSDSAAATQAVAGALGRVIPPGTALLLTGQLGAGKTTFVKGLAAGLGVTATVTSPTFALICEYDCPWAANGGDPIGRLVHMDFYRLASAREAMALGLADYLNGADVVVIEWPERAEDVMPRDAVRIHLVRPEPAHDHDGDDDRRRLTFTAGGPHSAAVLAALAHALEVDDVAGH